MQQQTRDARGTRDGEVAGLVGEARLVLAHQAAAASFDRRHLLLRQRAVHDRQ